ncbi:MAG: sulfotransferase [Haliea sp.]|nr:sulfotransferase [Haliea sp.]
MNNPLPLPVRLLNLCTGRGRQRPLGLQPVNLSLEKLLQTVCDNTGLSDFGEDDFRAPLALLLKGLEQEANLSLLGRIMAKTDLVHTLENRLGFVALFKQHPEIGGQKSVDPSLSSAHPRPGTTIFHDPLVMDPDNRVPLTRETARTLPPPDAATYRATRASRSRRQVLDQVDKLLPEFKKMHPMGDRAPECVTMTNHDFTSMIYGAVLVPTYDRWVCECDIARR